MSLDFGFCFLSGILSCLTPEALLLLPLLLAAAGTAGRASAAMAATGLGLALVVTGAVAVWLGAATGFEAIWLRRMVCAVLIVQGIALLRRHTVDRFPGLTGGVEAWFNQSPSAGVPVWPGTATRLCLLALIVGANWIPRLSPMLGKASLMAADAVNIRVALAMLFVFGLGAAVPWLAAGRIARFLIRPIMPGLTRGMAGKRLLGLTLLVVAVIGLSGTDTILARMADEVAPPWTRKLASMF